MPISTSLESASSTNSDRTQDLHTIRTSRSEKAIRRALNRRMTGVECTRDAMLVVAVAQRNPRALRLLPAACVKLMQRLYEMRPQVTNREVLGTISTIFTRLQNHGLPIPLEMYHQAVLFAARCRNRTALRRFLQALHAEGVPFSPKKIYTLMGKVGVTPGGLQDRLNGRWKQDDLMELLTGFKDLTPEDACHLEMFADTIRQRWELLRSWVRFLSLCGAEGHMEREWEIWLRSPMRRSERPIQSPHANVYGWPVTAKTRGDMWFVHRCQHGGFYRLAWRILGDSDLQLKDLVPWDRDGMLAHQEFLPESDRAARAKLELWRSSTRPAGSEHQLEEHIFNSQDIIAQITTIQSR